MNNLLLFTGGIAVPFVSLIVGIILWRNPPSRNPLFGFRTKLSMSGDKIWYTAQRLCGRLLTAVCAPLTLIAAAVMLHIGSFDNDGKFIVMCAAVGVETAALAAVNFAAERLLKKDGEHDE